VEGPPGELFVLAEEIVAAAGAWTAVMGVAVLGGFVAAVGETAVVAGDLGPVAEWLA
jgi:hypothetical protein